MFKSTTQITFLGILASFVPFPFALIPTEPKRRIEASLRVMNRVGGGIIEKAKAAIAREVDGQGEKTVTKSDVEGRDVISMLSASVRTGSKLRTDICSRLSPDDSPGQHGVGRCGFAEADGRRGACPGDDVHVRPLPRFWRLRSF
jgi:hypothetical protein